MTMRILVTGSSGTMGTRLCERLIGKHEFVGIDLGPNKWNEPVNKATVIGDLRDPKSLDKLGKFDLVIHLAANARVYNLVLNPELALDNIKTTFRVLEFCRNNKIPRVMIASSREIYGNSDNHLHPEEDVRVEMCESPYSASKLSGEALCQAYQRCYGLNFIILRFSNVYGMYDDSDRVIPLFIRLARQQKDLVVFGEEKALDFTYIDDTIAGILAAIENFDAAKNNAYNISSGKCIEIAKVAEMILAQLGKGSKIVIKGNRPGEVVKFVADITRAKRILGFEPQTSIEEGMKKTISWYGAQSDSSR